MSPIISLQNIEKEYAIYPNPKSRLIEILTGKKCHDSYHALHPLSINFAKGEIIGIVGMNGAGKSTLLKLIAGTLHPSKGKIEIKGKVASLLELGTGFHMDLTGRENVFMGCAIQGFSQAESERCFDDIVDFAELRRVIDQPVKTYSSGMMMRLAFSVATSVNPDILIIDEALSVGDARFAQKSFERIMRFCDQGMTILFCSHSLYQVETLCSRAIWLDKGRLLMDGDTKEVVSRYSDYIDELNSNSQTPTTPATINNISDQPENQQEKPSEAKAGDHSHYKIKNIILTVDDEIVEKQATLISNQSNFKVQVDFASDPQFLAPNLGVCFTGEDGRIIASTGNWYDNIALKRNELGYGSATIEFPKFALLKGRYYFYVYLLEDRGILPYDHAENILTLDVIQNDIEQGRVRIPRVWHV